MGVTDRHYMQSSLREQYLEYVFLGGLCQEMWHRGIEMDVLRAHTDQSGYDLALDAGFALRFVQLKSSHSAGRAASQNINMKLANKPGGCVVWILFDADRLTPTEYLWFGNADPNAPCPDLGGRIARRTTPNSEGTKPERHGIRILAKGRFSPVATLAGLADLLFGQPQPAQAQTV